MIMHFLNNTISKALLTVFDIEVMQNPCHMFWVGYRLEFPPFSTKSL